MPAPRAPRLPNGGHVKPNAQKYPWMQLAVGETRTVEDVPSRTVVYRSLAAWRDRICFKLGLGYTLEHCPQFSVAYDRDRQVAHITRVADGPIQRGRPKPSQVLQATSPQAKERAELWAFLERHQQATERASKAGEAWPMTPLDVMTRAVACDPFIAQRLADLDCGPRRAGDLTDLDDELLAQQVLAEPHNNRPLRRHDDRPDMPADRRLAARLTGP